MTRKQYYTQVWIYRKRRKALKEKYKLTKDERYRYCFLRITKKIKGWQRQIKEIDKRNKVIKGLVKRVNKFFNVQIESRRRDKEHDLARHIYYKIGLESKLEGKKMCMLIGRSASRAFKGRKVITMSFDKKPENKEAFHKFQNWMLINSENR